MTNMKAIKRALFSSVLALILCFAMLVGTTFAWFTDSVTSANNKIVAGTLDVSLLLWDGTEYQDISESGDPIFGTAGLAQNSLNTLWEPGKTQVAYLAIENKGSLDLQYKVNISVTDYTKNLYEVLEYAITPNAKDGAGAPAWTDGIAVVPGVNETEAKSVALAAGTTHYFALSVHMNEEAGNQYQGGEISFDLNVFATQIQSESDSFGTSYDALAGFPAHGVGNQVLDGRNHYEFEVYDKPADDHNAQKVGNVKLPAAALKDGAETTSVIITREDSVNSKVTVQADQAAMTYDVTVSNLKAGNTAEITVAIRIGAGYKNVAVYHTLSDGTVEKITKYTYNGEYVEFVTTSFSPFTIVYDADSMVIAPDDDEPEEEPSELPKAIITMPDVNVDAWRTNDFDLFPADADQKLDVVYKFVAPEGDAGKYEDWLCDYYVKYVPAAGSTMAELPAGTITLGGNYGPFGWIGFENPKVPVNKFIPLLGSVSDIIGGGEANFDGVNTYWTYKNVATFVGEFMCGVAVANGYNGELDGQFVVELRLTNPEDYTDYKAVNTVTYDFATRTSDIDGEKHVTTAQGLVDELNNTQDGTVVVEKDIDLNDLSNLFG